MKVPKLIEHKYYYSNKNQPKLRFLFKSIKYSYAKQFPHQLPLAVSGTKEIVKVNKGFV